VSNSRIFSGALARTTPASTISANGIRSFEPLPSKQDIETMQSIVEDAAVGVNFLVLLIVRLTRFRQIKVSAMMFQAGVEAKFVQVSVDAGAETRVGWIRGKLLRIFFRK
jgi:hypothetical protein